MDVFEAPIVFCSDEEEAKLFLELEKKLVPHGLGVSSSVLLDDVTVLSADQASRSTILVVEPK